MKKTFLFLALIVLSIKANAQDHAVQQDSTKLENLDEILIRAIRVNSESPITHSNLTKAEISKRNLGQDIPILMNYMPNVVTTTDAGTGVGYTGIRVRGSDATRVNVTINGIPYNDAESMGTYWVDLPDFASSTESLQLQRGLGSSTNGAAAFGASLNLLTDAVAEKSSAEISSSVGSFNTLKNTLKFSTGKITGKKPNESIEVSGRLSKITSDGYIDRASSDLKSYFLQGAYIDDNTLIKALVFGGVEKTYQAWYGTPKARIENDTEGVEAYIIENELSDAEANNLRNSDRRYNYYTYDNEVDYYSQDHYQLHWNQKLNENWTSNIALHYTWGRGYYEQYKVDEDFSIYGFDEINLGGATINTTDVIRRRWLDNDFYGTTFSLLYNNNTNLNLTFGGAWNRYNGDHYGEVIWAEYASNSQIRDRYYDNYGNKTDFNLYGKAKYMISENLNAFADLQIRTIAYDATGDFNPVNDKFTFFNPKAGLTYTLNQANRLYFSYARGNREPNRTDYENGNPEPETLNDFELGWRLKNEKININSNVYFMKYKNQLVLTGAIDDIGAPIRSNIGDSYRLGLELDANIKISKAFSIQPNVSISTNKNNDFVTSRDGQLVNLKNTNIAFSPNLVAANFLNYHPSKAIQIALLSKYVGEQYMSNIDSDNSKLESYFINDLNVSYHIPVNRAIKSINLNVLVNNIFNVKYVSNGYYGTYDDTWSVPGETTTLDYAGYYPQATTNLLVGATLKF